MINIRIFIRDLVPACQILGEVKVVAAGRMYATLECDARMRNELSKGGVKWEED